jgi:DNA-binding beta-propeller fold protein YncE
VADASNNRVVRVDDMAGAQWVALGPQCGSGPQVSSPLGLFVDRDGKIYVANGGNNMIQRMDDMAGTNCTSFGSGGSGTNEFSVPAGIFVDQGGKIYVADALNDRIVRIDDMSGRTGPALTHPARRATSSSTRPAAST